MSTPDCKLPNDELAEQMLMLFKGREDRISVGADSGIVSQLLDTPLTVEDLADSHLDQTTCLAFYPLLEDGTVWVSARRTADRCR